MSQTLADTRSALRATPRWAGNFVQTLLGSRFFLAVTALLFVAFLSHVTTAQNRFPPIARISFTQIVSFAPQGEPRPALPGEVSAQLREVAGAGRPYLQTFVDEQRAKVRAFYADTPDAMMWTNYIGLGLSGFFFMLALYLLARQAVRVD